MVADDLTQYTRQTIKDGHNILASIDGEIAAKVNVSLPAEVREREAQERRARKASAADTIDYTKFKGLYPGQTAAMQFVTAWGGRSDGFYVGAHDPSGYTKTLCWDRRKCHFEFHCEDAHRPQKHFNVPYRIVLSGFLWWVGIGS